MIVISLPLAFYSWQWALALFVLVGFFSSLDTGMKGSNLRLSNPIFLLVGPIWWVKKMLGFSTEVEKETKKK